eukprot:s4663_g8.t1
MNQVYQQLMKDVLKHRVLVVSRNNERLQHAISPPFEAVPKMLPNRTLSKEVGLAKKDVAGAFRLLWVDPRDVELCGGDVNWLPAEMGSPGEWNIWGRSTEELHRQHHPAEKRRDGAAHFCGKILVDDMVLVEPMLGLRPWVSSETYEWAVTKLLGAKAINAVKDAEEGAFAPSQLVWGVHLDAQQERMSLPEARISKGAYLLQSSDFGYGEKTLTLKDLQRFRGIATGWAVIVKGLKNELKAADRFLGGVDGGSIVAASKVGPLGEAVERAWEDLYGLCLRIVAGYVLAAIDWTNGLACREELSLLRPWVERALVEEDLGPDEKVAIHIGEMLSFVAFACKVGASWSGRVVVFGGDNKIVFNCVLSRKSGVRAGRILIRVLNLVEMRFRCQILGGWWRTFHNEDADALTRLDRPAAVKLMQDKRWTEVDIKQAIYDALEDTERFGSCFLSWADQEDRGKQMRLRELRMFRAIHRQPEQVSNPQIVEWTPTARVVCDVALVQGPRDVTWELLGSLARAGGWEWSQVEFLTSELGEALVRRRVAMFFHGAEIDPKQVEQWLVRAVTAPSVGTSLRQANGEDLIYFDKYEATSRWRQVAVAGKGAHGFEELYVLDKRIPAGTVRRLSAKEIWQPQGRAEAEWDDLIAQSGEKRVAQEGGGDAEHMAELNQKGEPEARLVKQKEEPKAEKVVQLQAGVVGDFNVQAQIEEWLDDHMQGDQADSTKKAYQSAWQRWKDWAARQGWGTPYLNPKGDPIENEDKILGYIGYLGWLGASVATLKQAIFAVKDAHKRAGYGDATGKMHRLWIVINSLDRATERKPRRLGVTVPMLKWVGNHLAAGADSQGELKMDCRMLQAALLTAWFFMICAREFADSGGVDEAMVLWGHDVQLSAQGEPVKPGQKAEEVTLQFRKTKADQEAFGTCKTMMRTEVKNVCVVEALERLREVAPRRLGGPESLQPLFRWSSGSVLKRLEVQNVLQKAARAVGLPAERFQSHSLRIGGASALFQAMGEVEVVKRTGRWTSGSVHRYLHDSGDVLKKLSQKMASVDQFIHYT